MADLMKRGLATDVDGEERRNAPAPAAMEWLKKISWETVNAKRRSQTARQERAQRLLRGFSHDTGDTT